MKACLSKQAIGMITGYYHDHDKVDSDGCDNKTDEFQLMALLDAMLMKHQSDGSSSVEHTAQGLHRSVPCVGVEQLMYAACGVCDHSRLTPVSGSNSVVPCGDTGASSRIGSQSWDGRVYTTRTFKVKTVCSGSCT
jgi:hypothetical protein